MKKIILCLCLFSLFNTKAQTFTIDKITSNTNGFTGPMIGVPGDLFSSTITFSNTGNQNIMLLMNRYKNDIPKYWGDCYCYLNCHNIYQDTITVYLSPYGTADVSIQFKTDSVTPGLAKVGFNVYQVNYQTQVQDIQMAASTMQQVGLTNNASANETNVFPNPTQKDMTIMSDELIQSVILYNVIGELKEEYINIDANTFNLNMAEFANGLYQLEINTDHKKIVQHIIKN